MQHGSGEGATTGDDYNDTDLQRLGKPSYSSPTTVQSNDVTLRAPVLVTKVFVLKGVAVNIKMQRLGRPVNCRATQKIN